jgi:scyllo-inositol 2-dehydrogenase (NAD+)
MSLRIGLIGAGRMGKVFAHTLAFSVSEADLIAVADPATGQETASCYGIKTWFSDYRALLDQKDIEAVVVASPTHTHLEVVKAAAAAGKQIFCEKPLAMTLQGCDEAIQAASDAGVRLMVGFMRRFDASYVRAKKLIDEGIIGKPVMFKAVGRDPKRTSLEFARRENSGGLILDMGIHDFDLARWFMGSEVERTYSEGGCLVFPELQEVGDIDNAVINLKFTSGAIGNVDVSRNAVYGYDIRTEILGSKGALIIGKERQTETVVLTIDGVAHDTVPYFMERFGDAYAAEIREFVTCIVENREPAVSGQDARAATAIGLAATRSLDEGRPVLVKEIK